MRTIKILSRSHIELYRNKEVVVFRVKKDNIEGHDIMILEEVA